MAAVSIGRALDGAAREVVRPSRDWSGLCLMFVRTCYHPDIPKRADAAIEAWAAVERTDRHPRATPPPGVPLFWEIGKHGHVALSAGQGKCFSIDIRRRGKADLVPIDLIAQRWGARYLGWADTLNGVRITTTKPKGPREWVRYDVVRGDTLSGIVAFHATDGTDWRVVWADPRNAELVRLRRRPELIRPGDRVWIP